MIQKLKTADSSLSFLREGYTFISSRCDQLGTDIFKTRIAGRPVVCMRGAEAAGLFYDGGRFTRRGALPPTVVHLLQDKGSVQTLDGPAHHHRKGMFLDMMSAESIARLTEVFERTWKHRAAQWPGRSIQLHREARWILTSSVCEWAGVPLADDAEVDMRAAELGLMIDQAGSFGPLNWWAQLRRRRTERWARERIEKIRSNELDVPASCPAALIAGHRAPDGTVLPAETAAVELLNVLRPVVAVDRFIAFSIKAMVEHPQWQQQFASPSAGQLADLEPFAQEVRRFYPFFPAIAGVALSPFEWRGYAFTPGDWVLLDIYGTNHDARLWPDPEAFRPERFRNWDEDPNRLIPQGGGPVDTGHRCPGERITLELVKSAVLLFAAGGYGIPAQDLTVSLSQLPAAPRSGVLVAAGNPQKRV